MPTSRYERTLRAAGYSAIAGVDEVGRGALFGSVFAAAVILNPDRPIRGLDDSKQLPPDRREVLAARIEERATAWAIGAADAFEIDHVNILQASRLAMTRAVSRLSPAADYLLIDALKLDVDLPQRGLIHGDSSSFSIAAASILAKVARDRAMRAWAEVFPGYGFDSNKGYGAPDHLSGLKRFGPTPLHRYSFGPVRGLARLQKWAGYPVPNPESHPGTLFACH
ncbi:MAG: ribonuclease HII [Acidobacteriota bacterium]